MTKDIKKLAFHPKTLDEEIVRDSLEAVSQLEDREPIYLIGGVATQSYLPTLCRRPTSDIDYALVRPLGYPDFREIIKPVSEFLQDKGYSFETKKGSRASMLIIHDYQRFESLAIEFARKNENSFQKRKKMLEREFDHTKTKIIEGRDKTYKTACPEDLVIPKIARSINSLYRNSSLNKFLPSRLESLSNEDVRRALEEIRFLREEAMINPGDVGIAEKLRFVSDLYDARILAEITGFNEDYLKLIEKEWLTINAKPKLRDKIFNVTFPVSK